MEEETVQRARTSQNVQIKHQQDVCKYTSRGSDTTGSELNILPPLLQDKFWCKLQNASALGLCIIYLGITSVQILLATFSFAMLSLVMICLYLPTLWTTSNTAASVRSISVLQYQVFMQNGQSSFNSNSFSINHHFPCAKDLPHAQPLCHHQFNAFRDWIWWSYHLSLLLWKQFLLLRSFGLGHNPWYPFSSSWQWSFHPLLC